MWIWGSGSGKGGGEGGEGAKSGDKVEGGDKKTKEDHFRLVLRDHADRGLNFTWRTSDLENARKSLHAKLASLVTCPPEASSPLGADSSERRNADSPSMELRGQEERRVPVEAYQSEADLLSNVVMVKIEKVATSDKSRVIKSLPLDTASFDSITSLRVLGAEVDLESNVKPLVRSSLQVLGLSGQKAANDKLLDFIQPALSPSLTSLSLRRNQLKSFPASSFSCLANLRELDLSDNFLLDISPSLFVQCPRLESLNLQNNPRLTVRELDFRACKLRTLLLGLIQLDYLPSLAHLSTLTELSLFSLYIKARAPRRDPRRFFEALAVHVELLKAGSSAIKLFPSSKEARTELRSSLVPVLRSSSSWHALLGALLACIANEKMYRALISSDIAGTSGLHHLLAMCEGSEPLALDACVAVSKLCDHEEQAMELLELQIVERFCEVLSSEHNSVALKLFVLLTLRSMAGCSQQVCGAMLADSRETSRRLRYEHYDMGISLRYDIVSQTLLKMLKGNEADRSLEREALGLLGDLAFHSSHRRLLLGDARMLATVRSLTETVKDKVYQSPCKERGGKVILPSSSSSSSSPRGLLKDSFASSPSKDLGDADGVRFYEEAPSSVLSPRIFSPIPAEKEKHRTLLHGEGMRMEAPSEEAVLAAALRVLAILGDNQTLSRATRLSPIVEHRGLRILSVDGGGVKGIASIRILQRLERACGQPLYSLFDLVAGTSAGGIIASAMGNKLNMTEAEKIYRAITRKAFSLPRDKDKLNNSQGAQPAGAGGAGGPAAAAGAGGAGGIQNVLVREELLKEELQGGEGSTSWWTKLVQSGSSMRRVLFQGAKYDAGPLMQVLQSQFGEAVSRRMIEASLDPHACKTAVVSTLVSERPIRPYVFRSYQLPPGMKESFPGRSSSTWLEAMRASSAAPYFFDEFVSDGERLQDGAIVTNNPAVVAVHEAQRLWPGRAMELMVSVGTGKGPPVRREVKPSSSGIGMMMETFGELMVEAATSSERVAEAFEVLSPMIPGMSIFRLQVEDERCNVEIDDIKQETLMGIEQAAEEFMEDNIATMEEIACILRSCAPSMAGHHQEDEDEDEDEKEEGGGGGRKRKGPSPINDSSFMLREVLNERPLGKHGIGSKLRALFLESLLPCEEGQGRDMVEMFARMEVPSQLLSFHEGVLTRTCKAVSSSSSDLSVSGEQELDISFLLRVLHRSTANVVQIECDTLKSGGDLILSWCSEQVLLSIEDAMSILHSSSSHADQAISLMAEGREEEDEEEEVDNGGEGGGEGVPAVEVRGCEVEEANGIYLQTPEEHGRRRIYRHTSGLFLLLFHEQADRRLRGNVWMVKPCEAGEKYLGCLRSSPSRSSFSPHQPRAWQSFNGLRFVDDTGGRVRVSAIEYEDAVDASHEEEATGEEEDNKEEDKEQGEEEEGKEEGTKGAVEMDDIRAQAAQQGETEEDQEGLKGTETEQQQQQQQHVCTSDDEAPRPVGREEQEQEQEQEKKEEAQGEREVAEEVTEEEQAVEEVGRERMPTVCAGGDGEGAVFDMQKEQQERERKEEERREEDREEEEDDDDDWEEDRKEGKEEEEEEDRTVDEEEEERGVQQKLEESCFPSLAGTRGCSREVDLTDVKKLIEVLEANRTVHTSPVEKWIFRGCQMKLEEEEGEGEAGAGAGGRVLHANDRIFLFSKYRARQIASWESVLEASSGRKSPFHDKVVVLRHAIPFRKARMLMSAGAASVVMPARPLPPCERMEKLRVFYASLLQGKSAPMAAAEANSTDVFLSCVY